jgi:hypothetical protein
LKAEKQQFGRVTASWSQQAEFWCWRKDEHETKALELKKLRQKKERLQYTVGRLELQSKQRERELRKSMAAVKD